MSPAPDDGAIQQLEQMLEQVLNATPAERERALAAARRDLPELARRLDHRLAQLSRFGFLDGLDAEDDGDGQPRAIGPYRVLSQLGSGGMGVVYLAQHETLARRVALKCIRREFLASGRARERFDREIRAIARLEHPGLCRLYEAGEWQGQPFLAMQFLAGEALDAQLRRARANGVTAWSAALSAERESSGSEAVRRDSAQVRGAVRDSVEMIARLADAVHCMHDAGLVHRDLKPANVMVTDAGPVLLDFGLARDLLDEAPGLTLSSDVVGTPAYMAPEQVEPRGRGVDARTDVHALAAMLYECLTLRPPFGGASREDTYRRILTEEPIDVRRLQPAATRDLASIVHRALDKEPRRRFASAAEFAEELRRVLRGEPTRTRPPGMLRRAVAWARQRPTMAATGATLVLCTVVGLVVVLDLLRKAEAAVLAYRASVVAQQRDSASGAVVGATSLDLGGGEPARSAVYDAMTELRLVRSWPLLNTATAVAASRDCRVFAAAVHVGIDQLWSTVHVFRDGREQQVVVAGRTRTLQFDASGERLLAVGHLPTSRLIDVGDGSIKKILSAQPPDVLRGLQSLALRQRIAFGAIAGGIQGDDIFLVSRDGHVRIYDLDGELRPERCFHFPPADGSQWLAADRDAATGAVLFGGSVDPTWHGRVALVDANGVECAGAGRLLEGPAALVAFAPRGGAWLAGTGYRRHWSDIDPLQEHDWFGVVVVLADGSSRELRGHSDYLTSASWSPDGEQVLTTSEDRTAMVWSIHDAAAALPVILRHEKTVDHGRFLPDGERILTGMSSHEAALWDRQGHKLSNLRGHVSGAVAIGVVGDGDQLLTASMDKRLLLWDGRSRWCEAWRTGGKVAAAGYEAGEGLVWSLTTGGLLQRWRRGARLPASSVDLSDHLQPHERMLSAVTWSKGLAIVTSNHRLLQFDTSGVRELWRSPQGADVASSVPVLPPVPHGRHLLVATAEQSLLDVAGGRDWGQLPAPPRGNLCWVASQPRGSRIAAGTDWASVAVWRTDRPGEPPVVTEGLGSTVMGVAWNVRDGGLFIATRDGLVIAFDENLTERWRQDLRGYLFRLFAAPDGSSVAVLCNDQRVRVLTADGELCLVLPAMDGRLRSCQFSADGRRLLVATYEGDLREWPLLLQASGREILSVETSPYREALEAAAKREERK